MINKISKRRTENYIGQLKASLIYKALAIIASFLAVPLMISYLGIELFGIWSTILSVMSWIVFFDLGLGNGLRNQIAIAVAENDYSEASRYISSGYTLIGLISFVLLTFVVCFAYVAPLNSIFNTNLIARAELRDVVLVSSFFIFFNFWLSLINQVLNATQKTSAVVFGQFVTNTIALLAVFILFKFTEASLFHMAAAYGISLVASSALLSFWFYRKNYILIPYFLIDTSHLKPLLNLGLQFFVIQIAFLIIFTTDKILITQLFGPGHVAEYDVVFKFFSVITILHSLITAPLWSAYTDAFHRGDFVWIQSALRKQIILFFAVIIAILLMVALARPLIGLWIGNSFPVSMPLVLSLALLIAISTWNNIFSHFLNGIGTIKIQLVLSIIAMIINIPLAVFFVKWIGLGINGIVLATVVSLLMTAVALPVQVNKIIRKRTKMATSDNQYTDLSKSQHSDSIIQP